MKWPASVTIIRHGESAYNVLKAQKAQDPEYRSFVRAYNHDYRSAETRALAIAMRAKYALKTSDYATPLSTEGARQAQVTGGRIFLPESGVPSPDVILISPYLRTQDTFREMEVGGFESFGADIIAEDRIREQEHGLSLLYSDWRIFHSLHPEQKELYDQLGPYWYQFPQGESVSQVRDRIRSLTTTFVREYRGVHVMLVSHHLTKLSIRANLERLSPEEFMRLDNREKPVNCGITMYRGNPDAGKDGKLELAFYNRKLY